MCGSLESPSSNFCTWGYVCFLSPTCHSTLPFSQYGKVYQTWSKAQAPQPALVGLLRLSCFKMWISSGVTAHCPWLLVDGQNLLQHSQLGLGLTMCVKQIGPEPLFIPRTKPRRNGERQLDCSGAPSAWHPHLPSMGLGQHIWRGKQTRGWPLMKEYSESTPCLPNTVGGVGLWKNMNSSHSEERTDPSSPCGQEEGEFQQGFGAGWLCQPAHSSGTAAGCSYNPESGAWIALQEQPAVPIFSSSQG